MMRSEQMSLAQNGFDLDRYLSMIGMTKEEYEEQIRSIGEENAKMKMLVKEIAEKEGMEQLTEADYKVLEKYYGYSRQMLVQMAGQEAVDFDALSMKVADFLLENANKVEAPEEPETEAAAETEAAETETAESEAAETEAAGTEAAGTETAESEAAAGETAGETKAAQ